MTTLCPICEHVIEGQSICPSCGYRLIDKTEKFQPIIVNPPEVNFDEAPVSHYIRIVRGPESSNAILKLDSKEVTIGRSPTNDLFLNDFSVSRNHAIVSPSDTGYTIHDNKSFNGLWINNVAVTDKVLVNGDAIQIGAFILAYEEE